MAKIFPYLSYVLRFEKPLILKIQADIIAKLREL